MRGGLLLSIDIFTRRGGVGIVANPGSILGSGNFALGFHSVSFYQALHDRGPCISGWWPGFVAVFGAATAALSVFVA